MTIPHAERNPDLLGDLAKELPGILAWAVRGCLDWQADGRGSHGLRVPERVTGATASYRENEDIVGAFIEDCCVLGVGRTPISRLFEAFEMWCEENKNTPVGKHRFNERIKGLEGVKDTKYGGAMSWSGLGLKTYQQARTPEPAGA